MKPYIIRKLVFTIACAGAWGLALAGPPTDSVTYKVEDAALQSSTLPPALRPALYRALAKDAGTAYDVNRRGCATLPKSGLTACFDERGTRFIATGAPLAMQLVGFGRGADVIPLSPVRPAISGNRVRYVHGVLNEWWRVLPTGFEQGFTIAKRPGGRGRLTLMLSTTRHSRDGGKPVRTSPSMLLGPAGGKEIAWGQLRYGDLVVTDATGKAIPATLSGEGDRIRIAVNDRNAVYPLTVDPMVWLEQKATAGDGAAGDSLGYSVAISGTTALVGAPGATVNGNASQGAAYVFTEDGGSWIQSAKLVANDGAAGDAFGNGVALDGTTALIGAPLVAVGGNAAQGAAYVFTESGGTWAQAAKLTADQVVNNNQFGTSVALDGTTALIGAIQLFSGGGAAYVFADSNGTWNQTAVLSASGAGTFGDAVALEGNTALVGAQQTFVNGNRDQGAAYVFSEADGNWTQSAQLVADDGATFDSFGSSVALDGDTALIGAPGATIDGDQKGAAYVFDESGGNWVQNQKLVAGNGAALDGFGTAVALQGSTALIGAPQYYSDGTGLAYEFSDAGGSWNQVDLFTASDGEAGDNFGHAVAFAGVTALVSASASNNFQGSVYFYNDLHVAQTDDDFESGNPNDWGWANGGGLAGTINPTGGNPGAWFDSGSSYYSDHPNLSSTPPDGSTLRTALASGHVVSARYDFERLDPGSCFPQYDSPSTFSLMLFDTHTDPGVLIEAHMTDGPPSPTAPSPWQTVVFPVPSSATGVPPGWVLNAPPELNYTWPELMQNLDGVGFFSINPDDLTYDACWHLGADNVKVAYRDVNIVTPRADAHGSIAPNTLQAVNPGDTASFLLTPDAGYGLDSVGGSCGGHLAGNTYTTDPVIADCTVEVSFVKNAGSCPDGYHEYDGTLAAGERTHSPIYQAPAGVENAILTAPSDFQLFSLTQVPGQGRKLRRIPGNEVHREAPAGSFTWVVKAGSQGSGGNYALCVRHP